MNLTQINFVGKLDYHRMWLYLYDLIFNLLVLSYFSHWLLCRLLLDNVTLETSGDYRCQVTKKIYLDFEIKIDAKNKKIFKIELMWGEIKIFKIWMELGKSHTIKCFSLEVFCSTQLRAVIASFRGNIGVVFFKMKFGISRVLRNASENRCFRWILSVLYGMSKKNSKERHPEKKLPFGFCPNLRKPRWCSKQ